MGDAVSFENVAQEVEDVLFDPQTSGGLLISVAEKDSKDLYNELTFSLANTVCGQPCIIGSVKKRDTNKAIITVK